jgi:hypothetical protein
MKAEMASFARAVTPTYVTRTQDTLSLSITTTVSIGHVYLATIDCTSPDTSSDLHSQHTLK